MDSLKNLAGNDVSIFLFRFDVHGNAIAFVLNQAIAADIYPDVDEQLKPLAHACCETLVRYKHLSVSTTIMDGNLLATGEFEVMLSKGLGRHIADTEKQQLFQDAKRIADLLIEVMDRRSKEEREGKQPSPSRTNSSRRSKPIKKGLEELGEAKRLQAELQWMLEGQRVRPGLKRMRPEDLPPGVKASRGYDHRGHCLIFQHETLGELGKIVLIKIREGRMLIQAELYKAPDDMPAPLVQKKKHVFEQIVTTVNNHFDENFPD
jgi:hypothetical protein